MTTVDQLLDQIDETLDDWETSNDAMRWTPDPPFRLNTRRLPSATVTVRIDEAQARAMYDLLVPQIAEAGRVVQQVGENLIRSVAQMAKSIRGVPCWVDEISAPLGPEQVARERALYARQHRNTGPQAGRYRGDGSRHYGR